MSIELFTALMDKDCVDKLADISGFDLLAILETIDKDVMIRWISSPEKYRLPLALELGQALMNKELS